MPRMNNQGYIEKMYAEPVGMRDQFRVANVPASLMKSCPNSGYLHLSKVYVPKKLVGKMVRIKIEVVQ